MKTRLLFVGDTHCGLKVGLLPKGYKDEYGKPYNLGASQKLIAQILDKIKKKAAKDCDELLLVLMSDFVQGPGEDHPREMDTQDVKEQCDMFIHSILPLAHKAKKIYSVNALSRFHADPGQFADDYIASELGAYGRRSKIRIDLVVGGIHFRFKHHGPTLGYRPHTRGDAVRRFLRDSHTEALESGETTPDVFVFAHWHQHYWESVKVRGPQGDRILQAFYTPPMTFPDKRTQNVVQRLDEVQIGMIALDVEDGKVTEQKWFERFSTRTVIRH